jgi:hypothetical protein
LLFGAGAGGVCVGLGAVFEVGASLGGAGLNDGWIAPGIDLGNVGFGFCFTCGRRMGWNRRAKRLSGKKSNVFYFGGLATREHAPGSIDFLEEESASHPSFL